MTKSRTQAAGTAWIRTENPSYKKRRYDRLKVLGICTNCGFMPAVKDRIKCRQCANRSERGRRRFRSIAPCTGSSPDFPNDSHKVPQ